MNVPVQSEPESGSKSRDLVMWRRTFFTLLDACSPLFAFFAPLISFELYGLLWNILYSNNMANLGEPAWVGITIWFLMGYMMIPCKHRKFIIVSWGGLGYTIGFVLGLASLPLWYELYWDVGDPFLSFLLSRCLPIMCSSMFFTFIFCRYRRSKEEPEL